MLGQHFSCNANYQLYRYGDVLKGNDNKKFNGLCWKRLQNNMSKSIIEFSYLLYYFRYFDSKYWVGRHLWCLSICIVRHNWGHAILFSYETVIKNAPLTAHTESVWDFDTDGKGFKQFLPVGIYFEVALNILSLLWRHRNIVNSVKKFNLRWRTVVVLCENIPPK